MAPVGTQDFFDVHHVYWPKRLYRSQLEKQFRQLPCNKVRLHRTEHNELHFLAPPRKPPRDFMLEAVQSHKEGRCKCNVRRQVRQLQG